MTVYVNKIDFDLSELSCFIKMSVNQYECNNNDVCVDTWSGMGQGYNEFGAYDSWQYSDSYESWDSKYDFSVNTKSSRGGGCSRSGGKGRTKADQKDNSQDGIYSAKHVRKLEDRATGMAIQRERTIRSERSIYTQNKKTK